MGYQKGRARGRIRAKTDRSWHSYRRTPDSHYADSFQRECLRRDGRPRRALAHRRTSWVVWHCCTWLCFVAYVVCPCMLFEGVIVAVHYTPGAPVCVAHGASEGPRSIEKLEKGEKDSVGSFF